ncbi:MAG TPA: class I adenylate-forming enzyme family protein [Bryobacteraceae bacterium]|nr:class I adenylate-forming enzyme family protein [Bryobacteraceae bacterium]
MHAAEPIGAAALAPRACLADHVAHTARESPTAAAVVFGETRWTYAELDRRVGVLASELLELGIRRGDRVATLSTPRPQFLLLFLAASRIGALWMGLNPRYRPQELTWLLEDARPALLAVLASLEGETLAAMQAAAAASPTACRLVEFGRDPGEAGISLAASSPSRAAARLIAGAEHAPDDPAMLVYTSGSTGRPKGALISHYGLCFGSLVQATALGLNRPKMICNLPINHVGCVADICSVVLVQGGTLVFQERFDPAWMLEAIEAERVTVWGGVPTMFQLMTEHPRFATADLSSVELCLWGGAAMPRPLINRLLARGFRLRGAYGLTETSCHVAFTQPEATAEALEHTIGRPTPHTPCRIVDQAGRACAAGIAGELQVFGRQNFVGYWHQPQVSAAAFTADGWLKTGDLAAWTEEGDIRLVGRLREVIKSGGYSIYPREIELALDSHPGVNACAVVGVPDPLFQEVPIAFVVAKPGQSPDIQALETFLRARLANYKVPKRIVLLAALPTLPIGKVDKSALRALAAQLRATPPGP